MAFSISSIAFGFVILTVWYFARPIAKLLALFLSLNKIADAVPTPWKPIALTPNLSPVFLRIFLSLTPSVTGLQKHLVEFVVFWALDSSSITRSSFSRSIFDVFF